MGLNVKGYFIDFKHETQMEIASYYKTIFKRKSGPPMLIALCVAAIVSFIVTHF